jgi:hypothetical protein
MAADDGMKKADIDPERLAALLDKRLDARERAALVAQLAASDDATLDALADAIAVTQELEGGGAADADAARAGAIPAEAPAPKAAPRRRPVYLRPLAIAAALAAIVLVPWGWARLRAPGAVTPQELALASEAQLPEAWDGAPWGAQRGSGAALSHQALSVRVGSRATDLEIALRSSDPRAETIAREIAATLSDATGAQPAAAMYRTIAAGNGVADRLRRARDAWRVAAPVLDDDHAALGAWLEAARLAAMRGNVAFFQSARSRRVMDRAAAIGALPEVTRTAIDAIRARTAAGGTADLRDAAEQLAAALAAVASG